MDGGSSDGPTEQRGVGRNFGYEPGGRGDEADEIRRIAEAVIAGQSLQVVARDLNERGVSTVTGTGPWTPEKVRHLLIQPRLAGLVAHEVTILCEGPWPAVLDRDRWDVLQVVVGNRGARRAGPPPAALGTGIYLCGVCGEARMQVGTTASGPTYKCANAYVNREGGHVARNVAKLDAYVVEALVEVLSRPGLVEVLRLGGRPYGADVLSGLRAERAAIRSKLNRLAEMWESEAIDDEQLVVGSGNLRSRAAEITEIIIAASRTSPLDVLDGVSDLEKCWAEVLTLPQQRAILSEVLVVTILRGQQGGRTKGGSYFDPRAVCIELTEAAAQACTQGERDGVVHPKPLFAESADGSRS